MIKKLLGFSGLLILGVSNNIIAQQQDFGDVSKEMLEMEVYEKDSTANAVVLFDVAEATIDENLEVIMKRHVRLKILTDDGLSYGDISLRFLPNDGRQEINDIKAQTYNLSESGKIEKEKLGRRDKFENEISETVSEIKFVAPKLKKGSIFEYEYEWKSSTVYDLPDRYFQRSIPVVWNDYRVKVPEWFTYVIVKRSYYDFHVDEQTIYEDRATVRYKVYTGRPLDNNLASRSERQEFRTERFNYSGTEYYWAMKDLPAIKKEPFMKTEDDYYAQVRFQLSRVELPNSKPENVLNTWPRLVSALEDNGDFGKRIDGNKFLKGTISPLTKGKSTELEKMTTIYDHLKKKVSWDGSYRLLADEKFEDVYESGTGSSAEINLSLVQMLREAGLNSSPVILSTRNNGEIIDLYPITTQFNHVITYAEADGNAYLLDATDKDRPFTLLPPNVMNGKGLQVDGDKSRWITLASSTLNRSKQMMNIVLDESGNMEGTLEAVKEGQLSVEPVKAMKKGGEERKKYILSNYKGLNIDSVSVRETDTPEKISYKAYLDLPNYLNLNSDVAYLKPLVFDSEFRQAFSLKDRKYPVDYEYPFSRSYITNITIPENWTLEESPKSVLHVLKKRNGEFKRLVQVNGNIITILYSLTIVDSRFMPEDYADLKAMYDLMNKSMNERFVLKKVS